LTIVSRTARRGRLGRAHRLLQRFHAPPQLVDDGIAPLELSSQLFDFGARRRLRRDDGAKERAGRGGDEHARPGWPFAITCYRLGAPIAPSGYGEQDAPALAERARKGPWR
jgi:hypothetical protein